MTELEIVQLTKDSYMAGFVAGFLTAMFCWIVYEFFMWFVRRAEKKDIRKEKRDGKGKTKRKL